MSGNTVRSRKLTLVIALSSLAWRISSAISLAYRTDGTREIVCTTRFVRIALRQHYEVCKSDGNNRQTKLLQGSSVCGRSPVLDPSDNSGSSNR